MVNRTRPAPVRPQVDPDFVLPDVGEATGLNALAALQPGECKFPINHVGYDDFRFCTAPAMESRPYCQHHWALTHWTNVYRNQESANGVSIGPVICDSKEDARLIAKEVPLATIEIEWEE